MADESQVAMLKRNVEEWNQWRTAHNDAQVRLESADLRRANLMDAILNRAILDDADLSGANLENANLRGASLVGANLMFARLFGASLAHAKFGNSKLQHLISHQLACQTLTSQARRSAARFLTWST
jgi:uncharacterized protein YjbI with pentapeptide repeats